MFYESLSKTLQALSISYEIIFVNDGSVDNSLAILKSIATSDKNVRIIDFSKNFGHEAAMLAGIDHCTGDLVVCLDADLQHPPSYIGEMLKKWREGNDIVLMVRNDRRDEIGRA
jgi:dolichol-phosphate mannosyltransferase